MKLYTEKLVRGDFSNISFYTGVEGFYHMGFEIIEVNNIKTQRIEEDSVCFGSINFVQGALRNLSFGVPEHNDYPNSLSKFYGRRISESTINTIANNPELWDVFVKPKGQLKKFTGRHVKGTKDLIGCGDQNADVPIWVSEPVEFVSEWRVFVRYNEVLGVRPYKGDWRYSYDHKVIKEAVKLFINSPAGYAIDFGRTRDGRLLIVEVNEGYSIGTYGLNYISYAKLISARWAEMTNQIDLCYF